jgi:DNA-binding MarR family transcriptional regulator|tara:strand:- start:21870 stop:22601 length:732 start_codon:yes stop_codon:yes gene_type:complete
MSDDANDAWGGAFGKSWGQSWDQPKSLPMKLAAVATLARFFLYKSMVKDGLDRMDAADLPDLISPNINDAMMKMALRQLSDMKHVARSYSDGFSFVRLTAIGVEEVEKQLDNKDSFLQKYLNLGPNNLSYAFVDVDIPASDRVVSLDHNKPEYQKISYELNELSQSIHRELANDLSEENRDRIIRSIRSANELWKSIELKVIQVQVGIVMALEDAEGLISDINKKMAVQVLIEAIRAFVRSVV